MTRVLVLRPEPGASATTQAARDRGLDALAVPLFEVAPVDWDAPEPSGFDGLLLTSANAVRHGGEQLRGLRGLKVYAVGEATAQAARERGFDVAATGALGIDRLLGSIDPDLSLLHPCGVDRRAPEDAPQAITSVAVYRAIAVAAPDLSRAPGSVALIHSPRAGVRFAELVRQRGSIAIAAISQAAAQAAGAGWKSLNVAEQPSEDALLALAARLCNNSAPE
jgi:uroporphyrinogen-III synthase